MIRFMLDTDDLSKLTGHCELLATYSDLVTNLPELRRQFPESEIILINRALGDPTGEASVFDIESGALTPEDAVKAYDDANKRGIQFLTVYHDQNDAPAVAAAFGSRHPWQWDATLDGQAYIRGYDPLHTPAIIQCLSSAELNYHADGSLVFADGWHPTRGHEVTKTMMSLANTAVMQANAASVTAHQLDALIRG